eukprot:432645_1
MATILAWPVQCNFVQQLVLHQMCQMYAYNLHQKKKSIWTPHGQPNDSLHIHDSSQAKKENRPYSIVFIDVNVVGKSQHGSMLFKTAGTETGVIQKKYLFMSGEHLNKEFCGKLQSLIGNFDWIWNKSKSSQYINLDFNTLGLAFGNGVVKNYAEANGSAFTVQCVHLKIIYYPKSKSAKNMKLEGLIKKIVL